MRSGLCACVCVEGLRLGVYVCVLCVVYLGHMAIVIIWWWKSACLLGCMWTMYSFLCLGHFSCTYLQVNSRYLYYRICCKIAPSSAKWLLCTSFLYVNKNANITCWNCAIPQIRVALIDYFFISVVTHVSDGVVIKQITPQWVQHSAMTSADP